MEKILVATDLSVNSISAILFAYHLSQTRDAKLIIVHVYHVSKPKSWRVQRFENHQITREKFMKNKFSQFLDQVFSSIENQKFHYEIDLRMNANTVGTIMKCAAKYKCSHLCISTHGMGKNKNTIGTTAKKIIAKIPIPVFSVPRLYKEQKIESICLVSNTVNYLKEIKKISTIGHVQYDIIRLLLIVKADDIKIKPSHLDTRILKRTGVAIKTKYTLRNSSPSLMEDIDNTVKKLKPSFVVFFINRYQLAKSLLYNADTPTLALFKKIPLLIIKK